MNSSGVVTLAREYQPFGSAPTTAGSASTIYHFTGEQRDETGLVYLRARYYASAFGRFVSRDVSEGYANRPMSYNSWLFVENNPVNYSDPSGRWRRALTGRLYHLLVENWYEGTPGGLGNPAIQLEYPIPGTAFRRPDIFNVATGDIYEIEPFYRVRAGALHVFGYQASLNAAGGAGLLKGTYALLFDYDGNSTGFPIGSGLGWPSRYRFRYPPAPVFDLVAEYVNEGVVAYWLEPNAGFYLLIAAGITARVSNMHLARPPDWAPQPAYQPAYVLDFELACRTALILAGGGDHDVHVNE